jgi:cytochrome d ubiquinol oxidase subunit I
MDALALARLQFALTTVYHFFFVPLTLGLSILVAVMETLYVRSGNETYKQMTKFWGKLFLINFAVGVVTGIVQEFQFGMNWSEYSRFVGDIFGAPLAIEALMAFFLESTFIAVWFFGWDKLGKRAHLAAIWLVVIASNLSALWILIANSFMQEPVGYAIQDGRAVMTDFMALVTNPNVWVQWPHVFFSGLATAAFFVLGVSAWHLRRKTNPDFFNRSFKIGTVAAVIGAVFVIFVGHAQAQRMVQTQPMKMASAEALYNSEQPASFSLLTIGDLQGKEVFAIRIPDILSLLACNNLTCEVKGINDLQAEYTQQYGPDDYVPPLAWTYWSFRVMVGAGFLMALLAFYALFLVLRNKAEHSKRFLRILPFAMLLPYLANTSGWLLTELGRQPWIVFGLMKTAAGVSNVVGGLAVLFSLVLFTAVYGALMGVAIYLFNRYGKSDPVKDAQPVGLY